MKTKLIRIGNSKGVRIPKPFLEETGLTDEIELFIREDEIVIRSQANPREGWDALFRDVLDEAEDEMVSFQAPGMELVWEMAEWTW
jgi:antitoxin MazE